MKNKDIVVAFGCLGAPIHIGTNKESRLNGNTQYGAMLKSLLRSPRIKHVIIMGTMGAETEKEQTWKSIDPENKIIYPLPIVHRIAQYVWGENAKFPSYRDTDGFRVRPCAGRAASPCHPERRWSQSKF